MRIATCVAPSRALASGRARTADACASGFSGCVRATRTQASAFGRSRSSCTCRRRRGTAVRRTMEATAAAASPPYPGILRPITCRIVWRCDAETVSHYDFVLRPLLVRRAQIATRTAATASSTVLREAVDYLESLYFYRKRVAGAVSTCVDLRLPQRTRNTIQRPTTISCACCAAMGAAIGPIKPDDVRMAIDNIAAYFAFVGIAEDMPFTLHRLSAITGFDLRGTGRENVTPLTDERRLLDRAAFAAAAHDHASNTTWRSTDTCGRHSARRR